MKYPPATTQGELHPHQKPSPYPMRLIDQATPRALGRLAAATCLTITLTASVAVPAYASLTSASGTARTAASIVAPASASSSLVLSTPGAASAAIVPVARDVAAPVTVPVAQDVPAPVTPAPAATLEPVVTSISRTSGSTSSTRVVTLHGTNLSLVRSVLVAGQAADGLQILSDTTLQFTLASAPSFQPAVVTIGLLAADGSTQTTPFSYTYLVQTRVDREMQYAGTHWSLTKSTEFGYLKGNDCANFTSQLLLARGWRQSDDWYNSGQGDWSASWVSSTALSEWLSTRSDLATRVSYTDRASIVVGDIVQFNWHGKGQDIWQHTAVVSKVVVLPNGQHDIYYTAHTNNQLFGGSTGYFASAKSFKGIKMQFWHLKK